MPKRPTELHKARPETGSPASQGRKTRLPMVNEKNIDMLEQETLHRVNKTLSSIEVAIATWDASDQPEDKKEKFMRYKWLHNELTGWERNMLMSSAREEPFKTRLERLQEFARICHAYAGR